MTAAMLLQKLEPEAEAMFKTEWKARRSGDCPAQGEIATKQTRTGSQSTRSIEAENCANSGLVGARSPTQTGGEKICGGSNAAAEGEPESGREAGGSGGYPTGADSIFQSLPRSSS